MINEDILNSVRFFYGRRNVIADVMEVKIRRLHEKLFGVDYRIFDKTRRYYSEVHGLDFSKEKALSRALNKSEHKSAWFNKPRQSIEEKMNFYQEVHIYPFRQPYLKRFGGFRWYAYIVNHIKRASILEYGCGSAVLTEYLISRFPNLKYTVADIPSVTLDFVKWKKKRYGYQYDILTIGKGKEGIPLKATYDLIVCQDVLEHTPNPLDIAASLITHLSPTGVLVIDFLKAPGGENLEEAVKQREAVKKLLKEKLIPLKAIDEPRGNNGLYVKDCF
jgi:2-polyprenyl-3-methyl-5-hydroxy-6-metoxy-1,4-benzoquinol methylase